MRRKKILFLLNLLNWVFFSFLRKFFSLLFFRKPSISIKKFKCFFHLKENRLKRIKKCFCKKKHERVEPNYKNIRMALELVEVHFRKLYGINKTLEIRT